MSNVTKRVESFDGIKFCLRLARDDSGCQAVFLLPITVLSSPILSFLSKAVVIGLPCQFDHGLELFTLPVLKPEQPYEKTGGECLLTRERFSLGDIAQARLDGLSTAYERRPVYVLSAFFVNREQDVDLVVVDIHLIRGLFQCFHFGVLRLAFLQLPLTPL
ncbi:hypothetical protein [Pseudomonas syringae]|uniref:hypothetical protein n=1 Tax=Pseudomonas syringae TaxID=317 RepID=UPI0012B85557|nr:hypothetical protein [Pseudomonas syringae]